MFTHDTLLLASGSAEIRAAMRTIFQDSFNLLEADSAPQTMLLLNQNHGCIASVLMDTTNPEKLDVSILPQITQSPVLKHVPIIVLTPPDQPEAVGNALLLGAIEAMSADFEPVVLGRRVQNIVDLHRHKWHLEELVAEQASILQHANDSMVDVLSSIIEYRSVESGQHILRIRKFTQVLLQELARSSPRYGLSDQSIRIISSAAALHDIGKISVPDAVLNKPGALTPEEWEIMKEHSAIGSRIIEALGDIGDQEYLRYAYNICRYHHERWDGSGYPEGLAGDHIPICAQAVGLADAYDALTSNRVYKTAINCDQAANMICNGECGAFSPRLLECFKNVAGRFAELAHAYADGLSPKAESFDTQLPGPDQGEELDALQIVRGKYQTMLHYVDAAVAEVDVEQGTYHVVYNPDPNLAMFNNGSSLRMLAESLMEATSSDAEKQTIRDLEAVVFPRFLREGHLRMRYRLPVYTKLSPLPETYEITILRQDYSDTDAKKLLVIWQHIPRSPMDDEDVTQAEKNRIPESILPAYCRYRNDRMLHLEEVDGKLCRQLDYTREELLKICNGSLMELILPEDREKVRAQIATQMATGKKLEMEFRLRHRDGTPIWVFNRCRMELAGDGGEVFSGFFMDISQTKRAQDLLQRQLDQQQIILAQTENVIFEWDVLKDAITFSDNWDTLFGYEPLTQHLFKRIATDSHFHPEDIQTIHECVQALYTGEDFQVCEVRIAKADGRYLWCRMRATAIRDKDGQLQKIVGIIINIDEEKRSAQKLQERAERDSLTKLLNKHAARKQVDTYLENYSTNARCAMFIIDLDNFKQINDRYGHLFGDSVLVQISREIRRLFRSQDIVARIGGDEFLVLMRGISDQRIVENRCRQLLDAFHNVMVDHLQGKRLSCSIGVAMYPQHGSSYSELFRHADQALYHAKDQGKNSYAIFDSADQYYFDRMSADTAVNERIDSDDQSSISNSNIIRYAFRRLYESGNVEETIQEILNLAGRQMNVSRVYIFENSEDNRFCNNTFEWCNEGILPQKDNLQMVSYEDDVPNFIDSFDEHGVFYCPDITQLPADLYQILEPQNIKSMLTCAIRDNGVMRGYVGFDDCLVNRYWTKEQINLLSFFAEMLSVFLIKKRTEDAYAALLANKG